MSRELQRAKARYSTAADAARLQAARNLEARVNVNFSIGRWAAKAQNAYTNQWPSSTWNWNDVFRNHNDIDRLDIVMWSPEDRLSGLAVGLTNSTALIIKFLEGDPRDDCPLKGKRALIALECGVCYAQARGRSEIRVYPLNVELEGLYRDLYKFEQVTPRGGEPYWRRGV